MIALHQRKPSQPHGGVEQVRQSSNLFPKSTVRCLTLQQKITIEGVIDEMEALQNLTTGSNPKGVASVALFPRPPLETMDLSIQTPTNRK